MENPSLTATGYVDTIDAGVARVLIGRDEAEWFFPMTTLPEGVAEGDDILFLKQGNRYASLGFARVNMRSVDHSIEDRLHRPLAERRAARALLG
jgi:hypothetical protein